MLDLDVNRVGIDWTLERVTAFVDHIEHIKPSDFSEEHRYLPESVTSIPGPMRFEINPFMREIVDCADVDHPAREITLMKGAQITYTTGLETVILYALGHLKTLPVMYMTADKELATERIDNCFIPMINDSGFADRIRSADVTSKRKSGKTSKHIQWEGGGYLVPFGAVNANKMRQYSICFLLKDELDAWPDIVGRDGDPDSLSDERCAGYYEVRKIIRGSTPLIKGNSKIYKAYKRGDQRQYNILCLRCGYQQSLRWEGINQETRKPFGFTWELNDGGGLILESVSYLCQNCGHPHYEADKENLFSPEFGAEWVPTAVPAEPHIYSYHLPALYSPIGMRPWHKCVSMYLEGWDHAARRVRDITKYQVFYNNILAKPFKVLGSEISFRAVSAHRRACYRFGEIPNAFAEKYSGSRILFLTCQVDVHKHNLAVAVMGWTRGGCSYLIDYWRFEDDSDQGCDVLESPVWGRLRELIEETTYTAPDGREYGITITAVDAGYSSATVAQFCSVYQSGVYPVIGRESVAKRSSIKEYSEYKTQSGTVGYKILVDHYKERMAPVLRREWHEDRGPQNDFHFNAPLDATDVQLTELTREIRREKTGTLGQISYEWFRPGNARNELWDLLVYGNAIMEIFAWHICIGHFELDVIEWDRFWDFAELTL